MAISQNPMLPKWKSPKTLHFLIFVFNSEFDVNVHFTITNCGLFAIQAPKKFELKIQKNLFLYLMSFLFLFFLFLSFMKFGLLWTKLEKNWTYTIRLLYRPPSVKRRFNVIQQTTRIHYVKTI